MKTIRLITFLFFSYVKCQTLQSSFLDAAMQHTNSQNYLEENLRDIVSIMVAQFLQKSTFEEVQTIVKELLNFAEKCKSLKLLESPSECSYQLMTNFLEHICNNQGMADKHVFSNCCNKNNTARHKCFLLYKKGDSSHSDIFQIPNPEPVCEIDKENQVSVKERFLYEYSRRHPELALPVILRVIIVYQNLLEKCCKLENPLECYSHGKETFQKVVRESHEHIKNHCDLREKLGDSNFHDRLLVLYTKKAPQLSAQELVAFTKNMAAAATKCCPLSDEQKFVCVEDTAKLIFGALCRRHEAEPINDGVGHCCDDSYAFRKPCFDDLHVDRTYISPPLSCDQVISLTEELCKAEEEFQTEKQKLLSNLVKQKPYATEVQFQSIITDFTHLAKMCCQAEKSEICFQEEESKLIEKCQSLLGSK